jgi:hypothetical protein
MMAAKPNSFQMSLAITMAGNHLLLLKPIQGDLLKSPNYHPSDALARL